MDIKEETKPVEATGTISSAPASQPQVPPQQTQPQQQVAQNNQMGQYVQEEPVDPMDIKPENSVLNKTVSGGVDLEAEMANAAKQAQQPKPQQPIDPTMVANSLNNEIVKPKMNYSLIAVIAGIIVLGVTAAAYYFLVMMPSMVSDTPEITAETNSVVEETPVVETPVSNQNVNTEITQDEVINEVNSFGNSDSTTQIQEELDSLDFEGIDTSLQLSDF